MRASTTSRTALLAALIGPAGTAMAADVFGPLRGKHNWRPGDEPVLRGKARFGGTAGATRAMHRFSGSFERFGRFYPAQYDDQ